LGSEAISVYVPTSTTKLIVELYLSDEAETPVTYKFDLSGLNSGNTYDCNVYKYLAAADAKVGDVYLTNGNFARVLDSNSQIIQSSIDALASSVWGVVIELSRSVYKINCVSALKDYGGGQTYSCDNFPTSISRTDEIQLQVMLTNSDVQSVITAFNGDLPSVGDYYWIDNRSSNYYCVLRESNTVKEYASDNSICCKVREQVQIFI
jgi:hypothetical protein